MRRSGDVAVTCFAKGDRVYWHDPDDGLCSGPGTVVVGGEGDDVLSVAKDDGGEVECTVDELTALNEGEADESGAPDDQETR